MNGVWDVANVLNGVDQSTVSIMKRDCFEKTTITFGKEVMKGREMASAQDATTTAAWGEDFRHLEMKSRCVGYVGLVQKLWLGIIKSREKNVLCGVFTGEQSALKTPVLTASATAGSTYYTLKTREKTNIQCDKYT